MCKVDKWAKIGYALNLFVISSVEDANESGRPRRLRRRQRASITPSTQINHLLSRQNLTNSLYLAKFLTPALTLPLHALADERIIAQITADRDLIRRVTRPPRRQ